MKRYRSLAVLLLVALLLGGLFGCQKAEAPQEEAQPQAQEETGKLPDLGGRKITVAVENAYPPFNFIDPATGEGKGWDYDAVREICKRLNCVPEFKEAAWEGIFDAMAAGEYDVLADGVTITEEREKIVDFSIPYASVQQVILVRADEPTTSVDDFIKDAKKLVGTQIGTTNEIAAKKHFPEDRIKSFEDFGAAILALLSGDIDGVVIDNLAANGFMKENPDELRILGVLKTDKPEQLGFVFPPGSELKAAFDAAIQSMIEDGTLQKLNETWGLMMP